MNNILCYRDKKPSRVKGQRRLGKCGQWCPATTLHQLLKTVCIPPSPCSVTSSCLQLEIGHGGSIYITHIKCYNSGAAGVKLVKLLSAHSWVWGGYFAWVNQGRSHWEGDIGQGGDEGGSHIGFLGRSIPARGNSRCKVLRQVVVACFKNSKETSAAGAYLEEMSCRTMVVSDGKQGGDWLETRSDVGHIGYCKYFGFYSWFEMEVIGGCWAEKWQVLIYVLKDYSGCYVEYRTIGRPNSNH